MALNYFCFFFVFGLTLPYLSPVLLDLGYDKREIGIILGIIYLCDALVPFLGGQFSDRFASADKTIRLCAYSISLFAGWQWFFASKGSILFLVGLFAFAIFRAPLMPLQDTLAMQAAQENPQKYSRQRLVGSIGFMISAALFGYLNEIWGIRTFFVITLVSCLFFVLNSHFIPKEEKHQTSAKKGSFRKQLSPAWWLWLLAMMCHWLCFAPYHYGFSLYLSEQKIAPSWIGWFWSIAVLSEITLFFFSGWFFRRWPTHVLLSAALFAGCIRWLILALFDHPFMIAGSQLLHGPNFALYYTCALQEIKVFSKGVNRASFQGLFTACVSGFSALIGSAASGILHEQFAYPKVVLIFVPIQVLAIFLYFGYRKMRA